MGLRWFQLMYSFPAMGMPSILAVNILWRLAMRTRSVLWFSGIMQILNSKSNLYMYFVLSAFMYCSAKSKSHVMSGNFTQVNIALNPLCVQYLKEPVWIYWALTLTQFSPVPTVPWAIGTKPCGEEGGGEGAPCTKSFTLTAKTERALSVGKETRSADSSPSSQYRKHPTTKNATSVEEDSIINTMHDPNTMYICQMLCTNFSSPRAFTYSLPQNFLVKTKP